MAVSFRDHDSPGDLNDSEPIVLWIKFLSTDSTFFFEYAIQKTKADDIKEDETV